MLEVSWKKTLCNLVLHVRIKGISLTQLLILNPIIYNLFTLGNFMNDKTDCCIYMSHVCLLSQPAVHSSRVLK